MTSLPFSFYKIEKPLINELVLVIFTKHADSHIEGRLLEYNCDLFMKYSDATKKRKVSSWNKIVPLNKLMVAKVDDPNHADNIVQVSLSYLHEDKDNKDEKSTSELPEPFNKNKQLISIVKKIIFEQFEKKDDKENDENNDDHKIANAVLKDFWEVFYTIDKKRRDEYEPEDLPALLDYCISESDTVKQIFSESNYNDFYSRFNELITKIDEDKPKKIVSRIEIISTGGYKNTMMLFEKALKRVKFTYSLKYDTAPVFVLETNSTDSSYKDHNDFVKYVQDEGLKLEQKTYVKFTPHVV
jgi:hypothetical protein